MTQLAIRHTSEDYDSYRAARVKSLFNCEDGYRFDLDVELPIEEVPDWKLGVVVGPSGSGKTSIGHALLPDAPFYDGARPDDWPADAPIIDAIDPEGDFDAVTGALSAVGLGSVPAWMRPYSALSNGERFRADLARIICEGPTQIVIDEFTSVVDRQIALVGALAFAKAWRRTGGQAVLLTPHYDVLDALQPDWSYDTGDHHFARGWLQPRPRFEVEIRQTDWRYWPLFEPHHYLKAAPMTGGRCYVATVDGELVAHLGMASVNTGGRAEARACRLVVMPEWQGAGVGMRFLNRVCEIQRRCEPGARLSYPSTVLFHTSHPGLCAALRRDPKWRQVSAKLHGSSKAASVASIRKAAAKRGKASIGTGYGGHFRAVQGFRYYGEPE